MNEHLAWPWLQRSEKEGVAVQPCSRARHSGLKPQVHMCSESGMSAPPVVHGSLKVAAGSVPPRWSGWLTVRYFAPWVCVTTSRLLIDGPRSLDMHPRCQAARLLGYLGKYIHTYIHTCDMYRLQSTLHLHYTVDDLPRQSPAALLTNNFESRLKSLTHIDAEARSISLFPRHVKCPRTAFCPGPLLLSTPPSTATASDRQNQP